MKGEPADRFVRRRVDIVRRPAQGIALNVAREALAVTGGAQVIGEQHHEAGLSQEMVVPAAGDGVAPHAGVAPMD